jgi:OPA family sugar phosphate sensor protein UhpC-like MFS transporter
LLEFIPRTLASNLAGLPTLQAPQMQSILLGILLLLAAMITRYAINSWGNVYLQEIRGFDLFDANLFIFLNTAAGILGCVAYGYMSDKLFDARRPPTNLIFGLMELLPLFVIFYGPANHYVLAAALVVYGFGLSGILASLGGLFAVDIAPKKVAGAAMGFIGIFSYLGAGLQDYISGVLIYDSEVQVIFSISEASPTVYFYDYSTPILFWVGASVVSVILASCLWNVRASD